MTSALPRVTTLIREYLELHVSIVEIVREGLWLGLLMVGIFPVTFFEFTLLFTVVLKLFFKFFLLLVVALHTMLVAELVIEAHIFHVTGQKVIENVVVTLYAQNTKTDALHLVVVPRNVHLRDRSVLPARHQFVIVAREHHIGYGDVHMHRIIVPLDHDVVNGVCYID